MRPRSTQLAKYFLKHTRIENSKPNKTQTSRCEGNVKGSAGVEMRRGMINKEIKMNKHKNSLGNI